jgi:hypothetical protein
MRAELLMALAPLPELVFKDSTAGASALLRLILIYSAHADL